MPLRKSSADLPIIKWSISLEYAGPYPRSYKRFYTLETLQNALLRGLKEHDRFIWGSWNKLAVNRPFKYVHLDLVYEDNMRLLFHVTLGFHGRKGVLGRMVVAKNHEECSAYLRSEMTTLKELSVRSPRYVVCPLHGGVIFLPDRHRRNEVVREVFAYTYKIPSRLVPLYVASSRQFGPRGQQVLRYSLQETNEIKKSIVKIIVSCYNPKSKTGISPEHVCADSFAYETPTKGNPPTIVLTQCPRITRHLAPWEIIQQLLISALKGEKCVLPLAPEQPLDFFNALMESISKEEARAWCEAFFDRIDLWRRVRSEKGIDELPGTDYVEVLREICLS